MMILVRVAVLLAAVAILVHADCVGQNGDTYPDNTGPYPAGDGCNLCHCADGTLVCTEASCGCYNYMTSSWVSEGSTVVAMDGCLKCQCSGGNLTCESMGCGCRVGNGSWVASGTSYKPDCNWCSCGNLHGACTLMGCAGCYTDSGYRNVNETWTSEDGCNTCTCVVSGVFRGQAACTEKACI